MKVVELFAGVGGFRLGLERAGHEVVWANEWDKYAAQTYNKNFGGQIEQRDITTIAAKELPEHDIICGGFPCQAFSVAGKRKGFDETRGTLFFEILRLALYHRTKYLFLENVKGLLNHDGGRTFEVILEALDESGYDVQWQVLNSKDFGVPQNRERIIIIANLRSEPRPEVFPIFGAKSEALSFSEDASETTQSIATRHLDRNGKLTSPIAPTVQATETPHIIQVNQRGLSVAERVYDPEGIAPTLSANGGGGGAKTGLWAIKRDHGEIVATKDEALTIDANYHKGLDNHGQRTGIYQRPRGNNSGGMHDIAPTVSSHSYQDNNHVVSKTIRVGGQGSPHGSKQNWDSYEFDGRIRRLTPMECERLQGFPDGWTAGVSDTQRYKQMGNAVTVNVIQAVAERL